jgi:lysophospholipase L1-like esterase
VLKVIRENLVDLKVSTFKKPLVSYKSRIQEMMLDIRVLNPDAPIYVLGIYNPFYLNFPDLTAMQNIIDNWNAGTKDVVSGTENAYFIPINDLLYKGIDGKEAVDNQTSASTNSSTSEKKTTESSTIPSDPPETVTNDALYEGDQFHPNNLGYQIMAGAVFNEMVRTEAKWNK